LKTLKIRNYSGISSGRSTITESLALQDCKKTGVSDFLKSSEESSEYNRVLRFITNFNYKLCLKRLQGDKRRCSDRFYGKSTVLGSAYGLLYKTCIYKGLGFKVLSNFSSSTDRFCCFQA
jgi:hypothetical protein